MSVFDAAAVALRTHWNAAMTDTVTVAPTTVGLGVYNPTTQQYDTPPDGTAVYDGAAVVVPEQARPASVGQERSELVDVNLYLPYDTVGVEVHQVATITDAPLASELVGRTMLVVEVQPHARNARIRVGCQLQDRGTP